MPETETADTCLVCDEEITNITQVDVITFELEPCGHHIDDWIYENRYKN